MTLNTLQKSQKSFKDEKNEVNVPCLEFNSIQRSTFEELNHTNEESTDFCCNWFFNMDLLL